MLSVHEWNHLVDTFFECPGKQGVYVLGCFATNVTLYTQQVRAFNLITGLHATGRLKAGDKVGVVGGGAAGLSAAAAAAHLGYKVHLFEQNGSPLELQLNNRQRWIHPYIYDWPAKKTTDKEANLPLLNWDAAYAEIVATQIEESWKELVKKYDIQEWFSVPDISIAEGNSGQERFSITRSDEPGVTYDVDHVIVAVGFGIEKGPYSQSYWAEDDFDFGFDRKNQEWLISGLGDGALTDLMRICIKRFRHEKILGIFNTVEGIENCMEELKQLELQSASNGKVLTDESLSAEFFRKIQKLDLKDRLKDHLRTGGPGVTLVGKTHAIFGRRSSVLNRLIVAILADMHKFRFLPGETDTNTITPDGGRFALRFKGNSTIHHFHRIILRHGTAGGSALNLLPAEYQVNKLQEAWKARKGPDLTAERHWDPGKTFGPETKPSRTASQLTDDVLRKGVRLRGLTYQEDVKGDGSSIITYVLEGLSVVKGGEPVHAVRLRFRSASGMFGEPRLDDESVRQGYSWEPDAPPKQDTSLNPVDRAVARRRIASGTVKLPRPLHPDDPPVSFSLFAVALNSNALTEWEFQHLYQSSDDVRDLDGTELVNPTRDYLARFVYFPVDTLTTRVNLPQIPGLGSPEVAFFRRTSNDCGDKVRTLTKDGIVHLSSPPGSRDWFSGAKWVRHDFASLGASATVTRSSPYSVELTIAEPHVGDAFTISWSVSSAPPDKEFDRIVQSADALRNDLIAYAAWRRDASRSEKLAFKDVSRLLVEVHGELAKAQQRLSSPQPFEIGLMTLNRDTNRIESIDGVGVDGLLLTDLEPFFLPYGVGVSGACFKRPDRAYIYHPDYPLQPGWPEYYLAVEGRQRHKSIISLGLDHPNWFQAYAEKGLERSRQCIAVLDIGAQTDAPWFRAIAEADPIEVQRLMDITQKFADKLAKALGY